MIEVIGIDGAKVQMDGGYFETLVYVKNSEKVEGYIRDQLEFEDVELHQGPEYQFIEIKSLFK